MRGVEPEGIPFRLVHPKLFPTCVGLNRILWLDHPLKIPIPHMRGVES